MDFGRVLYGENVGGVDLMLRAFVGTLAMIILAWGFFEFWPIKVVLALLAFAGLFTSMTRHCTAYSLLGFSTAKK
ncbi:MAG: DUF2892 domain-containing protein [Candidatus Altiarchaeota archaeon]